MELPTPCQHPASTSASQADSTVRTDQLNRPNLTPPSCLVIVRGNCQRSKTKIFGAEAAVSRALGRRGMEGIYRRKRSSGRVGFSVLVGVVFSALACITVWAQSTAQVSGTVKDQT